MKTLIALLTLTISSFSYAEDKPAFTCVEESGFTYEFYMGDYHEIHQYDEKGEFIDMYDGFDTAFKSIETFPSIDQYTFYYADGGNEIAIVEFTSGSNTGSGEMIDHDQKMECKKN